MTQEQLRAGIYGRESKDSEKSITDQIDEARDQVSDHGWSLRGEYSDGDSASRFGTKVRKDWQRLLADMDAGELDVIVCWEPSRADRDLETWVAFVATCRRRGVLVHLVGDDVTKDPRKPSDWKSLVDGGVDAAYETEKLSARVRRGVRAVAKQGGIHGTAPYGYLRVTVGENQTRHGIKVVREQRPDPQTAPVVVDIFRRLARKQPIVSIEADLIKLGIPSPTGGLWNRHTIRKVGLNVAYLGQRRHLDAVYVGSWDALVDEELFNTVNAILSDPRRKTIKPGKLKHLLTYLAVAPCGGSLHFGNETGGRIARYKCLKDGCTTVPQEYADEYVSRAVVKRLCLPDAREAYATTDSEPARLARLEAAAYRRKLEEAKANFRRIDGKGISSEMLAEQEQYLTPLIKDADRRSVSPSSPVALLELLDAAEGHDHAEHRAEAVRAIWDRLPVPAGRDIVRTLFAVVRLELATRRLSRFTSPDDQYQAAAERVTLLTQVEAEPAGSESAPASAAA